MKVTELKIGDLVLYQSEVAEVDCVRSTNIMVYLESGYWDAYEDDIAPIPLTEEILEKNGWKKQCSNLDMPGWSNNHVKLYPQDKKFGGGFSFFYSGNSVQYVHHVHQLQHILWALGLDDNLKI